MFLERILWFKSVWSQVQFCDITVLSLPWTTSSWRMELSQTQSYFTTGGLPPISSTWRQAPWGSEYSNFIFQLNTCCHSPYVTSCLTTAWVCRLQLLLVLASAVILRSETRGTHDHILLSHIRDSPNLEPESYITTDGQSVSPSWSKAPVWGLRSDFYYCQLVVCWCGVLFLTRGRVCRLQLLLALATAVIFGSEPLGTRDGILLSQIREFSFRRLLRLAGLRWRCSTPPLHRRGQSNRRVSTASYIGSARTNHRKQINWSATDILYCCQVCPPILCLTMPIFGYSLMGVVLPFCYVAIRHIITTVMKSFSLLIILANTGCMTVYTVIFDCTGGTTCSYVSIYGVQIPERFFFSPTIYYT
jgi:hypothetical protein